MQNIPRSLRSIYFILASLLLSAVLACAENPPIKIGLIAELSGTMATNGENCRQGFEVARKYFAPNDQMQGRSLSFIYGDSQGEAKTGISEFNKLVEVDHVIAVALNRSAVAMAINPISKQKKIPLFGVVGHPRFTRENEYAFRFWPSAEREGQQFAEFIYKSGKRKIAIFTFQDEWLEAFGESIAKNYLKLGGQVVVSEKLSGDGSEFASFGARLKSISPDAIFLNLLVPQYGVALRRLKELGLNQQIYANYWIATQDALAASASNNEGIIYDSLPAGSIYFQNERKDLFGRSDRSGMTTSCYYALGGLLSVLRDNPKIATAEELYRSAAALKEMKLAEESLEMQEREAQIPVDFMVIRSGRSEPLRLSPKP